MRRCLTIALISATAAAQDPVETLLSQLTVEQKAGQLFMSWSLSRAEGSGEQDNHARMLRWVQEAGLGGVILSLGTVDDAAALVPRLQAAAKVPLLLAGDFEGGVWFRLTGASELGNQMLVGATGSARLAEAMGRVTAGEAKALGFHWVFAPVLDVNSNPANPIINVRSFGEDPRLVAKLGAAFARGVRSAGLIACGKHFPGHGDVDSDSHLELPTVPGDGARLRAVELFPFAVAAQEGLESVMTGHLAVPGLGEEPGVPATLSRRILHDVLRVELGFRGLVVTDALEMGGVKNAFPPGEVAVRALLAGADVLLMPPDPIAARAAVVAAVQEGRVPMARLDDAVRAILGTKAKVGLLGGGGRPDPDWRSRMRTDASMEVAAAIAGRGLTLVQDRGGNLPLSQEARNETLLVHVFDRQDGGAGRTFAAGLRGVVGTEHTASGETPPEELARIVADVARAQTVVLALHVKVREYEGAIGLPPSLRPLVAALREEQRVVAVSFGSPYVIRQVPAIDTYVAAYVATPPTESAAASALCGGSPLVGRLPVSIPGVAPAGAGLSMYAGGVDVPRGDPVAADVAADLPLLLERRLAAAVADGAFPGAVCLVARHGRTVAEVAAGRVDYDPAAPAVTTATPFDLASLTKVLATTGAVLRLAAAGELTLDDPVQRWVPAFVGTGKEKVTLRHLLAHCGGLPAYERYYRTLSGKDAIVAAAAREGLMYEPGTATTYSDLGFVLLMAVVEAASGQPFEQFVAEEVQRPLQLGGATFVPTAGSALAAAAPTERDEARGGIVRGLVHDENAFAMGGVSGHAGLFATGRDVLAFGVAMLGGGRGWLPRDLVDAATRPAGLVPGDVSRGLGFQLPSSGSWAGSAVAPGSFGHTGFTGTSLLCDPAHDVCVVLLTNRVHPTRVNNKINAVRREVHDLVRDALR